MTDFSFTHHHGAISVADMEETLDWYQRVLGFALERRFFIPSIPADTAIIRNGDLRMEVFCVPGAAPLPEDRRVPDSDNRTIGNKHVAFQIAGRTEDFCAELERRGADIVWMKRMPHGAGLFIRDNSGNLIEFVEEPSTPSGKPASL